MGILKKYRKFLGVFAVISAIILMLFYNALLPTKKLPVYQPAMVNFELVDSTIQHQKKFHRIADFSLINQNGKTITQKDFIGKIYLADFFFTTCPTICIAMTDNLVEVQEKIKNNPHVMLLSHSVTPKIDTVAQLKKYALEKGVIDQKWHLVTGDKTLFPCSVVSICHPIVCFIGKYNYSFWIVFLCSPPTSPSESSRGVILIA